MSSNMIFLPIFLVISTVAAQGGYEKIKQANNLFAPDIYKKIVTPESGNVVISPLSAEAVLTLLYFGAGGESAQELGTALHLPDDKEEIKEETKNLLTHLQNNTVTTFEIANGVFVQKNFELKESFVSVAKEYFFATSKEVDFARSDEAAFTINQFVENNTNHLIKNLVNPLSLSDQTRLVLVNALRFKGNWLAPFSANHTKKEDFFTPNGVKKVDTIHSNRSRFGYYKSESLKAEFLQLFFEDRKSSFIIALPQGKEGLGDLEKQTSEVFVTSIPFETRYVNLALPKFKIEFGFDFIEVLEELGVNKIFSPQEADLSGIADSNNLYVSAVAQKAFIDLNEGGVEAAAATFVVVSTLSLGPNPIDFVVNRPFVFFLELEGVISFIGRVTDPQY